MTKFLMKLGPLPRTHLVINHPPLQIYLLLKYRPLPAIALLYYLNIVLFAHATTKERWFENISPLSFQNMT